jgi:hypothetical protein
VSTFVHPEVWSKKTEIILDNITVMRPLVSTDYEGEIKKSGDTIHVQDVSDITLSNYTRDTAISFQAITNTDTSILINQEKYFAFMLDKADLKQSHIEFYEKYTDRAAVAAKELVDSFLLSFHADVATANKIGTTSAPEMVTEDNIYQRITEMGKRMDDAHVPSDGRKLVVVPLIKQLLINNPKLDRDTPMGDKVVTKGYIGEIAGFDVHCTTNQTAAGSANFMLGFVKPFINFAMQMTELDSVDPYDFFAKGLKGLYLYGGKVLPNHAFMGSVLYHQIG